MTEGLDGPNSTALALGVVNLDLSRGHFMLLLAFDLSWCGEFQFNIQLPLEHFFSLPPVHYKWLLAGKCDVVSRRQRATIRVP